MKLVTIGFIFFASLFSIWLNVHCEESSNTFVPMNEKKECFCGKYNKIQKRIVKGEVAAVNSLPWTVAILSKKNSNSWFLTCGGTIIDKYYILSAAHCFHGGDKKDFLVDVDDYTLFSPGESRNTTYKVKNIIPHKYYVDLDTRGKLDNDIALLQLETPIQFNENAYPACLPPYGLNLDDDNVTVMGYGRNQTGGKTRDILDELNMDVVNVTKCELAYKSFTKKVTVSSDWAFCAGAGPSPRSTCQGDSGGPVVAKCNDAYTVVGIVSFGIGCGKPNTPGGYTNVSHFLPWIKQEAKGAELCQNTCHLKPEEANAVCGKQKLQRNRRKRVVGTEVEDFQYPWITAIHYLEGKKLVYRCGGTLISKEWVITSATCVHDRMKNKKNIRAVFGNIHNDRTDEIFHISEVLVHPKYNSRTNANNIALLQLNIPIDYNDFIPICLVSETNLKKDFSESDVVLVGWGNSDGKIVPSVKPHEKYLKTMRNENCKKHFPKKVQDSTVCTNSDIGGGCDGDTGYPLMKEAESDRFYLVAVFSNKPSTLGCFSNIPSLNIRISYYEDWIKQHTKLEPSSKIDKFY